MSKEGAAYTNYQDTDKDPYFDAGKAALELLKEDILWVRDGGYLDGYIAGGMRDKMVLLANLNDVFMWACSDAEDVSQSDVQILYDGLMAKRTHYVTDWACKKRNMQPQPKLKQMMIDDGEWTNELEALPPGMKDWK